MRKVITDAPFSIQIFDELTEIQLRCGRCVAEYERKGLSFHFDFHLSDAATISYVTGAFIDDSPVIIHDIVILDPKVNDEVFRTIEKYFGRYECIVAMLHWEGMAENTPLGLSPFILMECFPGSLAASKQPALIVHR